MKKLVKILVLLPLLLGTAKVGAQVTMGADAAPRAFSVLELMAQYKTGTYGGLRLPQMTTAQRTDLSDEYGADPLFEGLMIYNITIHCVEYWNATKWVSLCLGTANITLTGDCDPDDPFPADGTKVCTFVPDDEPSCETVSPPYSIYLITGVGYTTLQVIDPTTAEFSVSFSENNTAYVRTAIVRVVNCCSNEYKEFVFTQYGTACTASLPFSLDKTSTTLCGDNGAVIAWVTNPQSGVNYIWALSGMAVHTGNYMQITQAGEYTVYANLLGCSNPEPQTFTITKTPGSSSNAPAVSATNDGVLCSGGEVILTASGVTYPVKWFHNGILHGSSANPLHLSSPSDAGTWFATQQDGDCGSKMSNIVNVKDETALSTTLPTPVIYANGDPLTSGTTVCKNGTVEFEIYNAGVYAAGTLFEWFDNSKPIASGTATVIYYSVPDEAAMNLWVQASNLSGDCPATVVSDPVTITLTAPSATVINNGASTAAICAPAPATLLALNGSGDNYQWFKDGVSVGITTTPSYQAYIAGVYTVRFEDNQGCWSQISAPITVILSAPLSLNWNSEPTTPVNLSDVKSYTVTSSPAADSYTWSSSDESVATVTQIPPGNTVSVNYIDLGFTTIRVDAANACGPAFLEKEIEVVLACTPISYVNIIPNTTVNLQLDLDGDPYSSSKTVDFSASAIGGTTPIAYEWYVNNVLQVGETGSTFTYTTASSLVKTDSVYAAATNGCTASNTIKSIKVALVIAQDTLPYAPSAIVGSDNPCANATGITYSVDPIPGMTFTWTLPTGWTQTGGGTSNSITVTAGAAGGDIEVVANNSCCTGPATTLAVTVNTAPATPGAISGPTPVDIGSGPHTYNITAVPGATEYVWTLPAGWTGSSTGTSISATPPASGSSGSGDITVAAKNECGTSSGTSTYPVTVTPLYLNVTPTSYFFMSTQSGSGVMQSFAISTNVSSWTFSGGSAAFSIVKNGDNLEVYPINPNDGSSQITTTITISAGGFTKTVTLFHDFAGSGAGTLPVADRSYAGAFWRAEQTGERIIRISNITDAGSLGDWTASVFWMDGNWSAGDIVLDTDNLDATSLANRGINFGSVISNASISNAESYKLTGSAQSVSGTVTSGGDIIFRIGLKSTFGAYDEFNNPARYALIALIYNNGTKAQKIYLRQGEGADNVSTTGAHANVKWSPYNVGNYNSQNQYGYTKLTDYPTKAGFIYQWSYGPSPSTPRPYHPQDPMGSPAWVNNDAATTPSFTGVCPTNYKVPSGNTGEQASLVPTGTGTGSTWGYYADGWFDRRMIENANGINFPGTSSVVSKGNDDVAYRGRLVYNPTTNASLFLPASGTRVNTDGALARAGTNGYYWSTSVRTTISAYFLSVSSGSIGVGYDNTADGFSIRCVKN